jgi:hypothetical protein
MGGRRGEAALDYKPSGDGMHGMECVEQESMQAGGGKTPASMRSGCVTCRTKSNIQVVLLQRAGAEDGS